MITKPICHFCSNYQEEFYPDENQTENSCDILDYYCYYPSSIPYACPHFKPEEQLSTAYCLDLIEIKFHRLQAIRRKDIYRSPSCTIGITDSDGIICW